MIREGEHRASDLDDSVRVAGQQDPVRRPWKHGACYHRQPVSQNGRDGRNMAGRQADRGPQDWGPDEGASPTFDGLCAETAGHPFLAS